MQLHALHIDINIDGSFAREDRWRFFHSHLFRMNNKRTVRSAVVFLPADQVREPLSNTISHGYLSGVAGTN